jgi:proprotein convertase subtilisin/kexin type 5
MYEKYFYLSANKTCVTDCGDTYFKSASNTCSPCQFACYNCDTTADYCLSCYTNNTYNKYNQDSHECLETCPVGYYTDSLNNCIKCNSNCKKCITVSTTCTQCSTGLFLLTSLKKCVSSSECDFGQYADVITNTCSVCDASCKICSFLAKNCTVCAIGYITASNVTNASGTTISCVNYCPVGTVNDTANMAGCRCSSNCLTCQISINTCISCVSNLLLFDKSCLSQCPQSTYLSLSTSSCVSCSDSNCKSCN